MGYTLTDKLPDSRSSRKRCTLKNSQPGISLQLSGQRLLQIL